MPTPEAQTEGMMMSNESEAGYEIVKNVAFSAVKNRKGKIVGFQSSGPDRKVIKIDLTSSDTPVEGQEYDVEILSDSDPDNPRVGSLLVRLLKQARTMTQEEKDHWSALDMRIDEANLQKRYAFDAKKAVEGLEVMSGEMENRSNENPRSDVTPGGVSMGKREGKKAPRQEKDFANDVLKKAIEKARLEHSAHVNIQNELLGKDANGAVELKNKQDHIETQALIDLREKNLRNSVRKISHFSKQIEELKALRFNLKRSFATKSQGNKAITTQELSAYREVEDEIQHVGDLMETECQSSPEAWYGSHLKILKDYREEFSDGTIVETPSVKEKAEKLADILVTGQPVFIHGHLGSGKTEIARHIATEYLGKPYHMISGSRHMSPSEIYGHDVLTTAGAEQDRSLPFDKKVEKALLQWEEDSKGTLDTLTAEEKEGQRNRAQDRIIASLQSGATVSLFHPGPIYKAMELGEPLIIDELNAIPHDILIGLNDLLTRKPGDKVKIQQDSAREIIVAPGFCVMMAGNINNGDLQKYVDRKELDPAFVSRLHSEEYDYLPQRKVGTFDEIDGGDELFTLMAVMVMDKHANIKIPEGSLEKMWNLAKASKIFQDVFSGKQVDNAYYFQTSGVNPSKKPVLNSTVMSVRNLKRVFDAWRNDGFGGELDRYIYENFIDTSTDANDKAYIYQILQKQFGFFKTDGWEQNPNYGDSRANLSNFNVPVPKYAEVPPIVFMGPKKVVDTVFGANAPERKDWPEIELSIDTKAEDVAEALDAGIEKKSSVAKIPTRVESAESKISLAEAEQIMSKEGIEKGNFLGPEAVKEAFGIEFAEVPPIPFTAVELEKALELGQMLVLRSDITPDGKPLSMKAINEALEKKWGDASKGAVLNTPDGWRGVFPDYFDTEAPTKGWALVTKELIPDSTNKNYIQQTEQLVRYLLDEVFVKGIPVSYAIAIDEFKAKKKDLEGLVDSNWKQAALELSKLKINQLFRPSAVESIYDLVLQYNATNKRQLSEKYTWTNSVSSDGFLVFVGSFDEHGVSGYYWYPDYRDGARGVLFSRKN